MAIAVGDIKPGWYWVRYIDSGKLWVVRFFEIDLDVGGLQIVVERHGWEGSHSLAAAFSKFDFVARIEPPEGV